MKKRELFSFPWTFAVILVTVSMVYACTNDDADDLEACGCNFYPEINQYLPEPLSADDVIGEDTYYSGKELRELNRLCLERCN